MKTFVTRTAIIALTSSTELHISTLEQTVLLKDFVAKSRSFQKLYERELRAQLLVLQDN